VDFLIASTLPAMTEAKGIARAMAETSLPYLLSFIVRPTGHLLDGTALEGAIGEIDRGVRRPPLCYLLNCIHPSVFEEALSHSGARDAGISSRVLGLQANTSPRAPEDLEGSSQLECEDPELFAARMLHLHLEFGTRIMGGCCGTDARHIFSLARRVREMIPQTAQSGRKNDPEGKRSKGDGEHGAGARRL
jgi:homocysteine S-methyltransferase